MNVTPRTSWAIFCATKYDARSTAITQEEASSILDWVNKGDLTHAIEFLESRGAIKKGEVKPRQDWQAVYNYAHEAGMKAGKECIPNPMVVQQHSNPLNDNSPVQKSWYVSEGPCGFAFITIHPGNCSFAIWLRKNNLARTAYHGGTQVWVSQFNQSIMRKEAYANAFAEVLNKYGIKAYAGSRLD